MNIILEEIKRPNCVEIELRHLNAGEAFLSYGDIYVISTEIKRYNDEIKIIAMRLVTGEKREFSRDCVVRRVVIKATFYVE